MCLVIDTIKHNKNKEGYYKPLIAKEDILVYKILICNPSGYRTPFKNIPIVFKKGIAIQQTDEFGYNINGLFGCEIDRGIHSKRLFPFSHDYICRAIIPKGTEYYIGFFGDMISKKLIVFEKLSDYYNYINKNCK